MDVVQVDHRAVAGWHNISVSALSPMALDDSSVLFCFSLRLRRRSGWNVGLGLASRWSRGCDCSLEKAKRCANYTPAQEDVLLECRDLDGYRLGPRSRVQPPGKMTSEAAVR